MIIYDAAMSIFPQHFLVHEIPPTFKFISLGEIWMCNISAQVDVII